VPWIVALAPWLGVSTASHLPSAAACTLGTASPCCWHAHRSPSLPPLLALQDAVLGGRSHGVVTGAQDFGVFVTFFGGMSGGWAAYGCLCPLHVAPSGRSCSCVLQQMLASPASWPPGSGSLLWPHHHQHVLPAGLAHVSECGLAAGQKPGVSFQPGQGEGWRSAALQPPATLRCLQLSPDVAPPHTPVRMQCFLLQWSSAGCWVPTRPARGSSSH
jgi:hypothetical protein